MKLSIIIPCYNEEKTIIEILERLKKIDKKNFDTETIVINDCSTDKTLKLLEENKHLFNILISNPRNSGKGFSVKQGLYQASGRYIFFQDADLEYDVNDIPKFINLIKNWITWNGKLKGNRPIKETEKTCRMIPVFQV